MSAAPAPVAVNPREATQALDEDLPKVLKGRTVADAGWRRPDPLTLLIPLWATAPTGSHDFYLLRLHFGYYRDWPPSAQFVNPRTLTYSIGSDTLWLPKIEGCSELRIHSAYDHSGRKLQLICCSNTLEFYEVRHGVKQQHLWNGKTLNFAATLNAICRGLGPAYYKGRMG